MPVDYTWTVPTTLTEETLVNKEFLNAQLSENMRYLFSRPRDVVSVRTGAGSETTSNTTFTAVNVNLFRLNITVQRQTDLIFRFIGVTSQTSNNYGETMFDIYHSNLDKYISSLTATPLTNGISRSGIRYSNTTRISQAISVIYEDVPIGDHIFDLHWADDGSGGVSTLHYDALAQFSVGET